MDGRGEGHVKTVAEIGVMLSQGKEGPGATRNYKKQGRILPYSLWREGRPADTFTWGF